MRAKDAETLLKAATIPEGYEVTECGFLNYVVGDRCMRVVRIIGKDRFLMLFDYGTESSWTRSPRMKAPYKVRFLNEHNELVEFSPDVILEAGKTKRNPYPSWDRVIGDYLRDNGARSFTGRGWADDLAMKLNNLVTRWEKHYSNVKQASATG